MMWNRRRKIRVLEGHIEQWQRVYYELREEADLLLEGIGEYKALVAELQAERDALQAERDREYGSAVHWAGRVVELEEKVKKMQRAMP